jgi:uncharacterized protein YbjT (DUF2867 family)
MWSVCPAPANMPFYMEDLLGQLDMIRAQGAFSLTCAPNRPLPTISTRDVAAAAAALLTDLSWTGQDDIPVFGPDRLTPDGMAGVMGRELGKPIAYRRMTLDDLTTTLRGRGATDRTVDDITQVYAAQDEGIYTADWARARPTTTHFRTWCREVLKPLADTESP